MDENTNATDADRSPFRRFCISRKLLAVGAILAVWQALVLILALASLLVGKGSADPQSSTKTETFVSSLLSPTPADIQETTTSIEKLRGRHSDVMALYHEIVASHLSSGKTYHAAQVADRVPKECPKLYRALGMALGSQTWEKRPALTAVSYGYYDKDLIPRLRALANRPDYSGPLWQQIALYSELLVVLNTQQYEAARAVLKRMQDGQHGQTENVSTAIDDLIQSPDSSRARLELARSLTVMAYGSWYRIALVDLHWRAWDVAESQQDRAAVLRSVAPLYADWGSAKDPATGILLHSAAVRLVGGKTGLAEEAAEGIAAIADLFQSTRHTEEAIQLYGAVAADLPGTRAWARSTFNHGLLLRESGCSGRATTSLKTIFDSSANDMDSTPNLMTAYRNYRHRASLEISRAYVDKLNLPMAYYWRLLAADKYRYRSWCGTCAGSTMLGNMWDLLVLSLEAGPLFVVINLLFSPLRYWLVWLCLLIVLSVWRRRVKKRTAAA